MIRKLLLGVGACSLLAGLCVGVGALGAGTASASSPVTMTGTVTCTVYGRYFFSTPLTNGGTTPTLPRVYLQLLKCTGAGTKHGHVTVTGGILQATGYNSIANNCGSLTAGSPLPSMHGSVTWTTTGGTAAATNVQISDPWIYYDYNTNLLVMGFPTAITSGSYYPQKPRFKTLYSNASGGQLTGMCNSKKPGLATFPFGQPHTGAMGSVTIKGV